MSRLSDDLGATPSPAPTGSVRWSDIDKVRFFAIGTGMYSALHVLLHPVTVIKIRQQVLDGSGGASASASADGRAHQPTFRAVLRDALRPTEGGRAAKAAEGMRSLYRGLPITISLAVPARAIYIYVLEHGREGIGDFLTAAVAQAYAGPEEAHSLLPLVGAASAGMSGGVAALAAQTIVVPMDVIAQQQMAMDRDAYARRGGAADVYRDVVRAEGWRGLYRRFGLSILSSLPSGSVWWATYGGIQHWLGPYGNPREGEGTESPARLVRRGAVQLASGLSAAIMASVLTQPLDVVKTRLQVGKGRVEARGGDSSSSASAMAVARELVKTSGYRGFFRGTGPRIAHMGLWGVILSSAYELLRHVSRKDYGR